MSSPCPGETDRVASRVGRERFRAARLRARRSCPRGTSPLLHAIPYSDACPER